MTHRPSVPSAFVFAAAVVFLLVACMHDFESDERGACPRTAPPGARRNALVTDHGSAPAGGAAPFAATRFVVAVHFHADGPLGP